MSTCSRPQSFKHLTTFVRVWEAAAIAIGDDVPPLRDVQALPAWTRLRQHADAASRVFERRGKLPEDREFEAE